ncbi:MAG: DUF1634 domain-containing protein [Afipia felis]|nr:DUF1634 domain-containing protein [Afipia felis]
MSQENGTSDFFGRRNLETLLASLLGWGTIVACAIIACGMAISFTSSDSTLSTRLINIGIALFLFLPIARVSVMTVAFIKQLDFVFALIGFLVLLIIAISAAVSMGLY